MSEWILSDVVWLRPRQIMAEDLGLSPSDAYWLEDARKPVLLGRRMVPADIGLPASWSEPAVAWLGRAPAIEPPATGEEFERAFGNRP
jgi:hypothetical protein